MSSEPRKHTRGYLKGWYMLKRAEKSLKEIVTHTSGYNHTNTLDTPTVFIGVQLDISLPAQRAIINGEKGKL